MPESGRSAGGKERQSLARPVGLFALTSLLALAVTAAAVVWLLRDSSRAEAIKDAKSLTDTYAKTVVVPELTDAVLNLDPKASAEFAAKVGPRLADPRVTRIKIWRSDGTIVYSDEPRLIGRSFELEEELQEVLARGGDEAEIGDTHNAENVFEQSDDLVLEVYTRVQTPSGVSALFEEYVPYNSVQDQSFSIWWAFAPIVIAALALLWLVQLPVAWSMARRIRDGQNERERLLRRALKASDTERRRIAADLHNGVVQTMAGAAYSLGAVEKQLPADTPPDATRLLADASSATRGSLRELRSLLVDIYPARLREVGLEAALHDLVAPLQARGVMTRVSVELPERPPEDTEALIYRTAQEALHNVRDHALASHVEVSLVAEGTGWHLTVDDDGVGLDDDARALLDAREAPASTGEHMGLRLLREMASDADGELSVGASPLGGVRVSLIMGSSDRPRS
ncbi:MAG: histidine kinase [Candidatus Nanopelagicales bacterium]